MKTQAWDLNQDINHQTNHIPKIAICIPYIGNFHPEWVEKTRDPLRFFPTDFCEKIMFMSKIPSLPVSRDALVNEALKAKCDYIFWVDSDLIFESPTDPNLALKQLYQVINKDPNTKDGKMVSGLYRARKKEGFSYAMWMNAPNNLKGYVPIESWTGNWLEVNTSGLGCTLIDTKIFRDIERPFFYWETFEDISEDFFWFEKAKKHGYNLHVFTDVRLAHIGTMKVLTNGSIVMTDM